MNLTNDIILEFKNGYFEVQHKRVSETSGKGRLSAKKTFATQSHLEKYLAPYSLAQDVLEDGIKSAIREAGIKSAIAAKDSANRFWRAEREYSRLNEKANSFGGKNEPLLHS